MKDNRTDVMWVFLLAQRTDLPKEHLWDLPMVHEKVHEMALLTDFALDEPMAI